MACLFFLFAADLSRYLVGLFETKHKFGSRLVLVRILSEKSYFTFMRPNASFYGFSYIL